VKYLINTSIVIPKKKHLFTTVFEDNVNEYILTFNIGNGIYTMPKLCTALIDKEHQQRHTRSQTILTGTNSFLGIT